MHTRIARGLGSGLVKGGGRRSKGGEKRAGPRDPFMDEQKPKPSHSAWQRAFLPIQFGSRLMMSETFWPPKPNEFDIPVATRASLALLGTTSNGIAGSGIS